MTERGDRSGAEDFADRVDAALEAFWRGDATKLEHLVDSGEVNGPRIGELFGALAAERTVPVVGLAGPSQVSGYTIIRELGRGGMGVVYEAEQHDPRRRVAVKVLAGPWASEQGRHRFRREWQALARLRHPAIATIFEAGQTDSGQQFFTMELVTGLPLDHYVRQHELPIRDRLELFVRICEVMEYAHANDVIHRDLKPANILVDGAGNPRILDFGLARITDADMTTSLTLTDVGQVMSTLAYMSPEQAGGRSADIGPQSDVYALGVILYELLTDQLPYDLNQLPPREAQRVICEQPPRWPSAVLRTLRGDLETIVRKALHKDLDWRYRSAGELRADVRRYLDGEPVRARRPSGLYVLRKKLVKHRVALATTVLTLVIGLAGLSTWLWWGARVAAQQRAQAWAESRQTALEAMLAVDIGELDTGYKLAADVVARFPQMADGSLALAHTFYRRPSGQARHSAIALLQDALRGDRAQWACAALLAELYSSAGDELRAQQLEAQVLRAAPDTADAWYLRSLATLDQDRALRCAREAAGRPDAHVLVWQRLLELCMVAGDCDGALDCVDKLIQSGEHVDQWTSRKGDILAFDGRVPEAIAQYNAVLGRNPWELHAYWRRAHAYRVLGEYGQAIADYTTVVELAGEKETALWARYQRATVFWMVGEIKKAIEDFAWVRPRLGRAFHSDARWYLLLCDQGRDEEAWTVLNHALADVAADDLWLKKIFECLAGRLSPQQLVDDAAAQASATRQCEAYYYAGETYRLVGRPAQARACFEAGLQTRAVYDREHSWEPMNEYDLARWRLKQLPPAKVD